jgi:hypothetical protein
VKQIIEALGYKEFSRTVGFRKSPNKLRSDHLMSITYIIHRETSLDLPILRPHQSNTAMSPEKSRRLTIYQSRTRSCQHFEPSNHKSWAMPVSRARYSPSRQDPLACHRPWCSRRLRRNLRLKKSPVAKLLWVVRHCTN